MIQKACYFILIFNYLSSVSLYSQCYNNNFSIGLTEKLDYNVYYNFGFIKIKLADVKLWTEQGSYNNKKVLIIKNTTKTLAEYEWIIKVNDFYASYVDNQTMRVEKHIQKTRVDNYITNYEYQFNYDKGEVYASIENSKTKKFVDTLVLKPCLHDLMTAAYYPRNIDYSKLKSGSKINLPVVLDTSIHKIYFKYLGIEEIKTKNKKNISCVKIVPYLVQTSIFKSGEKMTAWFSNDKNRVPLRMESDLWIGKILVELVKYEGLRNPSNY